MEHLAKDCQIRGSENKVQDNTKTPGKNPVNRFVSAYNAASRNDPIDPVEYLYSYSEEEQEVRMAQATDKGSHSQCAEDFIQGIPAEGLVDSGADITINNNG